VSLHDAAKLISSPDSGGCFKTLSFPRGFVFRHANEKLAPGAADGRSVGAGFGVQFLADYLSHIE